jgi:hypothetical protein
VERKLVEFNSEHKTFAEWQPIYAQHGIATFPVTIEPSGKRPAIKGYGRVGLDGREQLVFKFAAAEALGFMCGPRTKISVGDVDTINERELSDFLDRHGTTPIITRTASGKFHAWYRHNGERRCIKPWQGRPFDILGGGFVVAPPSRTPSGNRYQFISGSLDDLDHLPIMRNLDGQLYAKAATKAATDHKPAAAKDGKRNCDLWDDCMRAARRCDTFENLLDVAR